MITRLRIQNFRSFVDAEVSLQPFSLVVGANGSGKTNFLRAISAIFGHDSKTGIVYQKTLPSWEAHANTDEYSGGFELDLSSGITLRHILRDDGKWEYSPHKFKPRIYATIFSLRPSAISAEEQITPQVSVSSTGSGTTQVLDMLKNGDREDLFDSIESHFRRYVPEVEKLSLRTTTNGKKQIQVRERGLEEPLAANELSEGTRIILAILTIIHQEKPPGMILLEDIDRGLHPRLFEYLTPLMKDIAIRHDINIIATTHNPYLVDAFQDDKEAVIIVEKKDGASTLSTLASRLEGLDYDSVDPEDMPLGQLWFSGLVGGAPRAISNRAS